MSNPQEERRVTIYGDVEALVWELKQLHKDAKSRQKDDQRAEDTRLEAKGR